ncbi:MAG: hypothetical protein ABG776_04175 [Cyanobacteria bacterium J06555_13]
MTLNYSYRVGGSLAWNDPSYVTRVADEQLYNAIQQGLFSKVLGPRQVGKSSLRIRTAHRLQQEGARCASVHATQLGLKVNQEKYSSNPSGWVRQLISLIWDSLYPTEYQGLLQWLEETCELMPAARLDAFTQSILLQVDQLRVDQLRVEQQGVGADEKQGIAASKTASPKTASPKTVIFIDEIDYLLAFPTVADTLFRWIAHCSKATPHLTFVILGTAIASDVDCYLNHVDRALASNLLQRSCWVWLENFQLGETQALYRGFQGIVENPMNVLQAIFCWTNGQPFLTQKLCSLVFNFLVDLGEDQAKTLRLSMKALGRWVSHMVDSEIVDHWREKDDPVHLRAIGDRITQSPNCTELIELYQCIAIGTPVVTDGSRLQAELVMSGLVTVCDQQLQFNNEIYRHVFDPLLVDNLCVCSTQSASSVANSHPSLKLVCT